MAYSSPTRKGASPSPPPLGTNALALGLPPLDSSTATTVTTASATVPAPTTTTTTTSTTYPPYAGTWPSSALGGTAAFAAPPMPYRMYGPHAVPVPVPVPVPYLSPRAVAVPAGGNMVVQTTHTVRNNHVIRAKLHDKLARIKKALSVGKRSPRSGAANTTTTTTQQTTTTNLDGSTTTTTTTRSTAPPAPLAPLEIPPLGAPLETITTFNTIPPIGVTPAETTTTTITIPPVETILWTPPVLSPGVLSVPTDEKLTISSISSAPSSTSESSPRLPDRILLSPPEDILSEAAEADVAELRAELEALPSIPVDEIPPPPPVEGDEDNAPPAPAEIVQDITALAAQQQQQQLHSGNNKAIIKGVQIVRQEQEEDSERIKRIDMRIAEITAANAINDSDEEDTEEEEERDTQAMLKRAMDGLHETERMINNTLERSKVINVTHKAAVEYSDGRGGTKQAARVVQGSCSVSG